MKDRITVRMSSDMMAMIDQWIGKQAGHVSRQEVVRRCVEIALGTPTQLAAGRLHPESSQTDDQSQDQEVVYLDT